MLGGRRAGGRSGGSVGGFFFRRTEIDAGDGRHGPAVRPSRSPRERTHSYSDEISNAAAAAVQCYAVIVVRNRFFFFPGISTIDRKRVLFSSSWPTRARDRRPSDGITRTTRRSRRQRFSKCTRRIAWVYYAASLFGVFLRPVPRAHDRFVPGIVGYVGSPPSSPGPASSRRHYFSVFIPNTLVRKPDGEKSFANHWVIVSCIFKNIQTSRSKTFQWCSFKCSDAKCVSLLGFMCTQRGAGTFGHGSDLRWRMSSIGFFVCPIGIGLFLIMT